MRPKPSTTVALLAALLLLAIGGACDKLEPQGFDGARDATDDLVLDDRLGLDVVLSDQTSLFGLKVAARDLTHAFATIKGIQTDGSHVVSQLAEVDAREAVVITVDPTRADAFGEQGYHLGWRDDLGAGRVGIEITAATEQGAMYGVYDVAMQLGVRYYHPERTFYPENPNVELPRDLDSYEVPAFEERGFHEHTQHPLPWADYFMVADESHRPYVTRYFQWLARNRQNRASFMMLKGIERESWQPYITDVIDEAHDYGIEFGFVTSFADEQQNGFKLIDSPGENEAQQIEEDIDFLAATGVDHLTMQIGTSEFTKPTDERALGWMQTAREYVDANHPELELASWIHILCELEAERGGLYYHLPEHADPSWTMWVHTTMFYTLEHPAPVYECEDFTHQIDFMRRNDGERRQVFFPETAWWLGFDNNMPVALPITGWSRAHDIQDVLPEHDVAGHITFTSGREWAYWQYDHYLTQVTWDASISWSDYLEWIEPMYGAEADALIDATIDLTERQVSDFYETNPLIYFYVAGELKQDEVGERAGILARRPKRSFNSIYDLDDAAFAAWRASDLELLKEMSQAYGDILATTAAETVGTEQQEALYRELRAGFELYVLRLQHAIALYEAVVEARAWREEQAAALAEGREPDTTVRDDARTAAEALLAEAQSITAVAAAKIAEIEAHYRYPLDLLTERRSNLTAYPFGYLHETHTAHFWTRRDAQLERFIGIALDDSNDAWAEEPLFVELSTSSTTDLLVPDDPLASTVIASFVPRLLWGLMDASTDLTEMQLRLAEDVNENLLPEARSTTL